MGNRAYVVFESNEGHRSPAIYLHWNGGPESIYAFLDAAKEYKVRDASDPGYAAARFCQIVANYFGGTLSIGLENSDDLESLDPGDNGLFVITPTKVKRFVDGEWLTDKQVERERKEAYAHDYMKPDGIMAEIRATNDEPFNRGSKG